MLLRTHLQLKKGTALRRHSRPAVRPLGLCLRSRPRRPSLVSRRACSRKPQCPARSVPRLDASCSPVTKEGGMLMKQEAALSSSVKAALRLVGIAGFSLSLCSWMGCCSTLTRFASTVASGAQPSLTSMPAWTGLSAGFLHTLAGPDHLAGLAPLTLGQTQTAAVSMGALWGFGHSSGQLLLGLMFLLLKERFHGMVPFLSKWASAVVGLTLIAIGIIGIYESKFAHHEAHADEQPIGGIKGSMAKRSLGTYAIGFVYGLQPDSLFVVLPALTLPTALATLSYVVMFVIGTVCAMAGYTLAIGTASEAASEKQPWLVQHLSTLAAAIALAVGLAILLPCLGCKLPVAS